MIKASKIILIFLVLIISSCKSKKEDENLITEPHRKPCNQPNYNWVPIRDDCKIARPGGIKGGGYAGPQAGQFSGQQFNQPNIQQPPPQFAQPQNLPAQIQQQIRSSTSGAPPLPDNKPTSGSSIIYPGVEIPQIPGAQNNGVSGFYQQPENIQQQYQIQGQQNIEALPKRSYMGN